MEEEEEVVDEDRKKAAAEALEGLAEEEALKSKVLVEVEEGSTLGSEEEEARRKPRSFSKTVMS